MIRQYDVVDASGGCDLAAFSGAATRYGNGGAVNLGTLGTRFEGQERNCASADFRGRRRISGVIQRVSDCR